MPDEKTLLNSDTTPVDPVVQTLTELDAHVASLTDEAKAEFGKLDAAGRVAALTTAKQTAALSEYAAKLTPEQKAEFEKLDAAGRVTAMTTAKQTSAYVEKLTPEQKAEFEKLTPEQKAAKIAEAGKPADAPPEKYTFKLPDGFKADEQEVDKLFRGLGLSQDKAQKLMDKYVEVAIKPQQELAAQQKAWREEIDKDPNGKQIITDAKRTITTLGDKETQALFMNSWLGDNPTVLRFLAKIASDYLKEDRTIHGKGGEGHTTKSAAQVIYPELPSRGN